MKNNYFSVELRKKVKVKIHILELNKNREITLWIQEIVIKVIKRY